MLGMMKRRGRYWVYLLECSDGTYYAGSTNDLRVRLKLHNAGRGAKYVRGRGPVRLVYAKAYHSCGSALKAEWDLKRQTRTDKERLVRGHKSMRRDHQCH